MKKFHLILILSFITPHLFAQGDKAPVDTVQLKYGWTPGIHAKSEFVFLRTKSANGETSTREMKGSQEFKTSEHADGLQVNFISSQLEVSASEEAEQTGIEQLVEKLSNITPSYVINQEGALLDVLGVEEIQKVMKQELEKTLADSSPEVVQQFEAVIGRATSREGLMTMISQVWNRDVAQWIGAEFEINETYETQFVTPIPFLGNAQIDTIGQYQYLGKVNCNEDDQNQKCAKLEYRSMLNEESLLKAISSLFEKMGGAVPEGFTFEIDYQLIIITEYDTLLPHSMVETKEIKVPGPPNEPPQVQIDRKEYRYTYIEEDETKTEK